MNKKIIYFPLIYFLSFIFFVCSYFALQQYEAYKQIKMEISDIFSEEEKIIEQKIDYSNEHIKYDFAEIDENVYYGFSSKYIKDEIYFFSTFSAWDEEKLQELANELYANKHGDEIRYLEKVLVYGSSDGIAAGSHYNSLYLYELPISFYNFLPDKLKYDALYEKSTISIYGVTEDTTIEDLAMVLSHEYGHHYTDYYFNLDGDEEDSDTEYYKLRAQGNDDVVLDRETYDHYVDNHMWYLQEIAADDYVYLMGSENAKRILKFYDSADTARMIDNRDTYTPLQLKKRSPYCINGMPHENPAIPVPVTVVGLAEYFYKFIDSEVPSFTNIEPIGTLNLKMENIGHEKRRFTWDQPYTDADVVYTLIGYDIDDNIKFILKTTSGDKEGVAYLGFFINHQMYGMNYYEHYGAYREIEEGTEMKFRVSVTFPDGTVLLSDPIVIEY
ncbi:MAG: hypothetical protein AB1Z23_00245 [Eubacteriales bacterium]